MPPKPIYKHCEWCKKSFFTHEKSKIYCNDICECRDKFKKSRVGSNIDEKTSGAARCPQCMVYFIPRTGHQIYCTQRCREDAFTKRRNEKLKKNLTYSKVCPFCKEKFTVDTDSVKYCTQRCRIQNAQRIKSEKPKKTRRKLPYHVLNIMAERDRLDQAWNRLM